MNLIISGIVGIIALVSGYFALTPTYDSFTESVSDILGSVSYPTSLDTLTNPSATDRTNVVSHSSQHSDANDAIEALEAKVGADGSAVTTSHDYKLSGVTGSDKAVSLTGTEVLTNKTLTAPTINSGIFTNSTLSTSTSATTTLTGSTTIANAFSLNLGSDATGDIFYRASTGKVSRLGVGSDGEVLTLSSGLPSWEPATSGGGQFRAYGSSFTGLNQASSTRIVFNTEEYDTFSAYATTTGYFTAPSDGYYLVLVNLNIDTPESTVITLNKNGGSIIALVDMPAANPVGDSSVQISQIVSLSQNDTLEVRGNPSGTSATPQGGIAESSFIVHQF